MSDKIQFLRIRERRAMRLASACLCAVCLASFAYLAFSKVEAWGAEHRASRLISGALQTDHPVPHPAADTDGAIVPEDAGAGSSGGTDPEVADGTVTGMIKIPVLHISAPITEGVSKISLLRGAGHVRGTAVAGGLGNMALAAHRDTFFRSLRYIRNGMHVKVSSADGTYDYQVDATQVIDPQEVSVLDIGAVPELTLITCYPFNYVGTAPQRFIVRAHLVSLIPQSN